MENLEEYKKSLISSFPANLQQHVNSCHKQIKLLLLEHKIELHPGKQQYKQLLKVVCCSDFVMRVIKSQPQWFFNALNKKLFNHSLTEQQLKLSIAAVFNYSAARNTTPPASLSAIMLSQQLRLYRNQQMLHIAWRDILCLAELNETMYSLSLLADICIKTSLYYLQQQLKKEFGTPVDETGRELEMIVIAMGKLGAYELNFSSDVDLIFVFPMHGKTIKAKRTISHNEFFIKLGQQLIKLLNETTAYGFVFRIDMRLRPFGKSGPLAVSIDAMEDYYAVHGREWERYALIKARLITGQIEDQNNLIPQLKAFVFRRYIDFSVFESLREMKHLIDHEVQLKHLKNNVKLGAGGIREIEFMTQAFQLLRGGREPELQQAALQQIIPLLQKKQLISESIASGLLQAYQFLRNTEHRIQELNDQQTHVLPQNAFDQSRLAYAMGFHNWLDFIKQLKLHQHKVEENFSTVFYTSQVKSQNGLVAGKGKQHPLEAFWCKSLVNMEILEGESLIEYQHKIIAVLKQQGFSAAREILDLLVVFRLSSSYRKMSSLATTRLNRLLPAILIFISPEGNSELDSTESVETLKRLLNLLESICRRSVYMVLLIENPVALTQLIKLCASSIWISRELARTPLLLDEFLDPDILFAPLNKTKLKVDLSQRLKVIDKDDLEQQMETLRHFKLSHVLRVAAADITGVIKVTQVSDYLTWIAQAILQQVLIIAWSDTTQKMAKLSAKAQSSNLPSNRGFAIIGFGKIGGFELGYGSDLDLVFIYANKLERHAHFFLRLGQRIMFILGTRSYSGILYECDMRLRPNGNSGQIATSLKSFKKYELEKAWLWEHQALCRARLVAGDNLLLDIFTEARKSVLCQPREVVLLKKQVNEMRLKMYQNLLIKQKNCMDIKQSRGGLVDIEFIVQFLILSYAYDYPDIVKYSDNIRMIDSLLKHKLISATMARNLNSIYQDYRNFIHRNTLQELPAITSVTHFAKQQLQIKGYWQETIEPA
ncbi:MAG: bifunctional [glutamate--ammonia ligase]-adenylyl-L-tyrosine phosphorylase/[glutamate--ammonia-ligase] adenylyltransferase [Pseudomonadota bacterium]